MKRGINKENMPVKEIKPLIVENPVFRATFKEFKTLEGSVMDKNLNFLKDYFIRSLIDKYELKNIDYSKIYPLPYIYYIPIPTKKEIKRYLSQNRGTIREINFIPNDKVKKYLLPMSNKYISGNINYELSFGGNIRFLLLDFKMFEVSRGYYDIEYSDMIPYVYNDYNTYEDHVTEYYEISNFPFSYVDIPYFLPITINNLEYIDLLIYYNILKFKNKIYIINKEGKYIEIYKKNLSNFNEKDKTKIFIKDDNRIILKLKHILPFPFLKREIEVIKNAFLYAQETSDTCFLALHRDDHHVISVEQIVNDKKYFKGLKI
jgi:hypothetical protein